MKKTTLILALLTAAILVGQIQAPTGQIKASYAGQSVTLNLTLYTAPTVDPLTCDATVVAVGQAVNCVFSITGIAPVPITVQMTYGASVSGPPTLTIPANNNSVTFTVTGIAPTAVLQPSDGLNPLGAEAYLWYGTDRQFVYAGDVYQLCPAHNSGSRDLWGC